MNSLDDYQRLKAGRYRASRGVTLIELIVFLVVISTALAGLLSVYQHSVTNSVDPIVRVRLLELAQSQLDEVIARKYDENTPSGGIPACGSAETGAPACAGIGLDSGESLSNVATLDDVDDFHNYSDTPYTGYSRTVSVQTSSDLGASVAAKRITVTVTSPGGDSMTLSTYRANF